MAPANKPPKSPGSRQKTTIEQRRKLFVEEFLSNGGNATKAAMAAGFSTSAAAKAGHRLSKNVRVRDEIDRRNAEVVQKAQENTQLTFDRVLRNLAQAVFFDPRKLYREDGSLKPVTELDDDTAQALAGFEVFEEFEGVGKERRSIGFTKKVKWLDKNTARDQALKHFGAFKKDNEQSNQAVAEAMEKMAANGEEALKAAFAAIDKKKA